MKRVESEPRSREFSLRGVTKDRIASIETKDRNDRRLNWKRIETIDD